MIRKPKTRFFVGTALLLLLYVMPSRSQASGPPRVIVTTDINVGRGDPDDRQSLSHLLWYANELDLRGIIPDRFQQSAIDACKQAFDCYEKDYEATSTQFKQLNFPTPEHLRQHTLVRTRSDAIARIIGEAQVESKGPLWILAWGNLKLVGEALSANPSIASNIRLISIGTNVKAKESGGDGFEANWNGAGRDKIFSDFPKLWWLEIDWTYNGMFHGPEAIQLKLDLAACGGRLGEHIADVINSVPWADNFRAGDTPSVLYLIDSNHNLDDPTEPCWAGKFTRPFPHRRPHYWTGIANGVDWDYETPSKTWKNASAVYQLRVKTLRDQRPDMYVALLQRVQFLYATTDYKRPIHKSNSYRFQPPTQLILEAGAARTPKSQQPSESGFFKLRDSGWVAWNFLYEGQPQKYPVSIRYQLVAGPPNLHTLFVNGAKLGEFNFTGTQTKWLRLTFDAYLETGPNNIVLRHEKGEMQVDNLTIGGPRSKN